MATPSLADERRKRVLLVLFIPSTDREGRAIAHQATWATEALSTLGKLFGGATAYPRAQGVWRDDDRAGALVFDEPVVCTATRPPRTSKTRPNLASWDDFVDGWVARPTKGRSAL